MQIVIDIPEHIYEHAKEMSEDSRDEFEAMRAIANGSQQEPCDGAISRQAAISAIMGEYPDAHYPSYYKCKIEELPSVTLKQRIGRWVEYVEPNDAEPLVLWRCENCDTVERRKTLYCPNCGTKMGVD